LKNLLATGGAGFIGTNFVYYWLNKYPEDHIIVLDALTYAGNKENLSGAQKNPEFEFIHGNILDKTLKDRPGHDRRYAINAKKISSELGYTPRESFDIGTPKTLDYIGYFTTNNTNKRSQI